MEKLPARTGWLWVTQGFALFRKQPGGLSTLFLAGMLLMLVTRIVPLLGQFLPMLLAPVFSVALLQACIHIEQGKRVFPNLLMSGLRSPALPMLLALGLLYLAAAALAMAGSALADGGVLWQLMTGQIDVQSDEVRDANVGSAILLGMALYLPAAMAFCFAAPLIYLQNMGVGKAVFFSFFAVLRSFKAFVVFAASWIGISILISQLLLLVFGSTSLAIQLMMPLSVVLTIILHCGFYASYCQVFGSPAAPQQGVSLDKPAP
jgi:hypothetical protein